MIGMPPTDRASPMRNVASRGLAAAIIIAVILIAIGVLITIVIAQNPVSKDVIELYKFELEMFKVILAGVIVAILGILIPAVVTESRNRFEQRKESRIAYSAAKTTIDYLKLRLSTASLAEATTAIQQAHFNKHIAELFDDFPLWLKKRYEPSAAMTAEKWDEMMYRRLFETRKILENNAPTWDLLWPQERMRLLDPVLPTVSEVDRGEAHRATTAEGGLTV